MPLFTNLKKGAIRLVLEGIVAAGREKAFVGWLENVWRDPTWERNRYYHLKESLLASLLLELRLVQGASLRTINIADQYIAIARRHLGSLDGRHIVELGPGRNLGAGIAFRYIGAASYSGIELNVGSDFNTRSTLESVECLARIKYGTFINNFNAEQVGFVPPGSQPSESLLLGDKEIKLVEVGSLTSIDMQGEVADFVYSNFTLEHIQEPAAMVKEIARLLRPGGVTAHFIDCEDHRDFSRPFEYLTFSDREWEATYGKAGGRSLWNYQNRYRASDFRRFFEDTGLEILEYTPLRSGVLSDDLRERLAPRFRAYDLADLQVVWLMIVARKRLT